ncbi:MAG: hypothetical protein ACOCQB_03670 [Halanaerobiaceae bacterium]
MKKYKINILSGHKTAMVIAGVISIISLIMILIFAIPMGITGILAGPAMDVNPVIILLMGIFMMMLGLIFYFIFTYLYVRLFCFLYNKLRPHLGGIQFSAEEVNNEAGRIEEVSVQQEDQVEMEDGDMEGEKQE